MNEISYTCQRAAHLFKTKNALIVISFFITWAIFNEIRHTSLSPLNKPNYCESKNCESNSLPKATFHFAWAT